MNNTYHIETLTDGQWSRADIEVTENGNEFTCITAAETAITELRQLGDDWAEAEYRVQVSN